MDPAISQLLTASEPDPFSEMNQSEFTISPARSPAQSPVRSPGGGSPAPEGQLRHENRMLKNRVYQIQQELQVEQDMVSTLRKKLNSIEKDRLDSLTKANEQVSRTDSELTRMRAAVEKGEAVRQNLEYEVARLRREVGQEKRSSNEREAMFTDVNESMKLKVSELSHQVEQLCQELEMSKVRTQEEVSSLNFTINEKDLLISTLRSEKDLLEAEKEKAESALTKQESSVHELEARIKEVEAERRSAADGVRRQTTEVEMLKDREQRFMRDLESAMARVKSLEEGIEAERAAHLESKFNSEIVQLRIRDLESALQVEKNSKSDAVNTSDQLARQIKELQQLCEEQQRESIQSREKLEKAEKEYALINQQLQTDLEKKNHVVSKLSKQLELHQKNFDELKDELNKAKKRQIYLEETYGGSMRELELLLNNFNLDAEVKKTRPALKKRRDSNKNIAPAAVLENLRHTLLEYKQRLDNTATELIKFKSQHEHLAKECESYKEAIWSKDKALENTAQNVTKTSKELQRIRGEIADRDEQLASCRAEAEKVRQALDKDRQQQMELKEQLVKVATKCKTDEQAHIESLHGVYQQLLTGRLSMSTRTTGDLTQSSRLNWNELIMSVQEEVANLMHSYHRANEKLQHIEAVQDSKTSAMNQMQQVHEEQLSKLATVAEDKGRIWQEQKAELEEHYGQLIAEIHNRQKKTQTLADQAWEKVRIGNTIQKGLELEVSDLRKQTEQQGAERLVLLATCSLLCGALYSFYARCAALTAQRNLLADQSSRLEAFRTQAQRLVGLLSNETQEEPSVPAAVNGRAGRGSHVYAAARRGPLLRFRTAVVSVLAANRLVHLAKGNCRMFTAQEALPGLYSLSVCSGGITAEPKTFSGISNNCLLGDNKLCLAVPEQVRGWLTSDDLMSTVMSTMTDLQGLLQKDKDKDALVDGKTLVTTARTSFSKFLCQLPSNFATVTVETETGGRERASLLRQLGHGLNRALTHIDLAHRENAVGSQVVLAKLQQQVLDFTRRLHAAEVERRDLRVELTNLRQERQNWASSLSNSQHMSTHLYNVKEQLASMVPSERFERVCSELDGALARERKAQQLLGEQAKQLKHLSSKYKQQSVDGSQKEESLSEATESLTQARQELKRQEQLVRQYSRQISQLEHEKKMLQVNIGDAENALRTAAKDKEVVTSYVKAVEKAIDKCKLISAKGPIDLTPILSPNLMPHDSGRAGPELAACQLLVTAFVDAQAQLNTHLRAVQDEVASHRAHVACLKRELSAACRREYDDQMDKQFIETEPTKDLGEKRIPSPREGRDFSDFQPVMEDRNESFAPPPRSNITNQMRSKYIQEKSAKLKRDLQGSDLAPSSGESSLSRSAGGRLQQARRPARSTSGAWAGRPGGFSSSLR